MLCETGARIILTGPSGTGKTALVAELGRRMGVSLHEHTGASLFARGWGRAEKNITAAVSAGRGCLSFFDGADALMGSRFATGDNNSHLTLSATSAFLAALQDAHPRSPIIAATNRVDSLDPAIRRRFDIILTTKNLPEFLETVAWQKLLKLAPGPRWSPISGTVPGDYVKSGRQMKLLGHVDPQSAAACIKRARDDRALEGIGERKMQVGFFDARELGPRDACYAEKTTVLAWIARVVTDKVAALCWSPARRSLRAPEISNPKKGHERRNWPTIKKQRQRPEAGKKESTGPAPENPRKK